MYREIHRAQGFMGNDKAAGTYMIGNPAGNENTLMVSGAEVWTAGVPKANVSLFYFDDADYLITGKTLKMRLRAQIAANATKPTIKFTFGVYPVTVAGGADAITLTLGTVVSGSTIEFNEPAASTITQKEASDFTIPADGAYALGVVTSAGVTNNHSSILSAQLQVRNV